MENEPSGESADDSRGSSHCRQRGQQECERKSGDVERARRLDAIHETKERRYEKISKHQRDDNESDGDADGRGNAAGSDSSAAHETSDDREYDEPDDVIEHGGAEDDLTFRRAQLAEIVTSVSARGGKLIIPAFAIGRVEEGIYWLKRLEEERRIPVLPVFVDSPMAARALQFYAQRADELDADMRSEERHVCVFCTKRMTTVASPQQSKELVASRQPAIVIASSGMATGGRVLYHLQAALPQERNSVLFVGFQAAGTRGRALLEGARTVRIKGRDIGVSAQIHHINSMSAHADSTEMLRWLGNFTSPPRATYLVHGEPAALTALQARVTSELRWSVHVAGDRETVQI